MIRMDNCCRNCSVWLVFQFVFIVFSTAAASDRTVRVVTGSKDAVVFLNDKKVGTGAEVSFKNSVFPAQIRVDREGYKSEYDTDFGFVDNFPISCVEKIPSKKYQPKLLAFSKVQFDEADNFVLNQLHCKPYLSGENKPLKKDACPLSLDIHKLGIAKQMDLAFFSTGMIDTSDVLLTSRANLLYLFAHVRNIEFFILYPEKNCDNTGVMCKTIIDWEVKSSGGGVHHKATKWAETGVFCEFSGVEKEKEGTSSLTERAFRDAAIASFYKLMEEKEMLFSLKMLEDSIGMMEWKPLDLKVGNSVTDVKSGREATVTITTKEGYGSGCVVSGDGHILTSYHVVQVEKGDSLIKVHFKSGDTLIAELLRYDELADLALLKVKRNCPVAFKLKTTSEYEISDEVFAIGTPASMELSQTVSKGIISGLRKDEYNIAIIQTDVSVNPGNSGGPLLKANGEFLGVVEAKIAGAGMEGLGFVRPGNVIINRLKLNFK